MKSFKTKIKRKIIILLGFCLLLSATFLNTFPLTIDDGVSEKDGNQGHRELHGAYFNNSMTPIYIDGDATKVGAHNWTWAANQPWCAGNGTQDDPYIIANLKINALGSSPIFIENSEVFFIIKNCTLYNSTIEINYGGIYLKNCENGKIYNNRIFNTFAGIHLISTSNTTISSNNCSSNGRYGIRLETSSNNNFTENDCSSNEFVGIHLKNSNNDNFVSGNNCSSNELYGIELDSSSNNTFLENDCSSNKRIGISLVSSNNNIAWRNNCSSNDRYGIRLESSSNNKILENDCSSNNWVGIHLKNSNNDNFVSGNNCSSNELYGIESDSSSNNTYTGNDCSSNNVRGFWLLSSSNNNLIYKNYFVDNDVHARDNGINNFWDNGVIGNYWDNYTGSDVDLDGIGDNPHSISGTGGGIDHYPIWFFYNLKPIFIDGDATGVGAHNWTWASYQPWCDGSGTWNDPYVIKDVIIDGQGTENCIEIHDSDVPFIIRNATLYNASPLDYKAAIYLDHINNSLIIENNCSYNGHIGIILYESCYNNIIQGNILHNNDGAGISLRYSPHNTICDNWIANSTGVFGVYLLQSHYGTFSNNTVLGSSAGIRIHATEHATVYNNTFELNKVGISLRHGHYSIITQNIITSSWNHGIFSDTTAFCEIHNNLIYNTTYDGIRLIDNSRYNEIYSNEIKDSSRYGANVDDTNVHNNTFYMNHFTDNDVNAVDNGNDNYWDNGSIGNSWDDYIGSDTNLDGIGDNPYYLIGSGGGIDNYPIWPFYNMNPILIDGDATGVGAHNWTWAENQPWCTGSGSWEDPYLLKDLTIDGKVGDNCITIRDSNVFFIIENCYLFNSDNKDDAGIYLKNTDNAYILNNIILNKYYGIYLHSSNNNTISGNNCALNEYGISLYSSSKNNIISDNNCSSNKYGLFIASSIDNSVSENNCSSNEYGIYLLSSNNNEILNNNCSCNSRYGIYLDSLSNYNNILENNCNSNEYDGIRLWGSNNNTISDNNCLLNDYYGIYLFSSNNNEIMNNNCSLNDYDGIYLDYTIDNEILENICLLNKKSGIYLSNFGNNTISRNNCSLNNYGISLWKSNYNKISENNCTSNRDGIYLILSSNNTIWQNFIYNSTIDGIRLYANSCYNTLYSNEIKESSRYGLYIDTIESNYNLFYLNFFFDNEQNAYDNGTENYWDNRSIGNYWDDYSGVDLNDDGIGDVPYNISGIAGSQDKYPIWDDDDISVNGGDIPGYNLIVIFSISLFAIIGVGYPIKRRNS